MHRGTRKSSDFLAAVFPRPEVFDRFCGCFLIWIGVMVASMDIRNGISKAGQATIYCIQNGMIVYLVFLSHRSGFENAVVTAVTTDAIFWTNR